MTRRKNRKYLPTFKVEVIETMFKEQLGYNETARRFGIVYGDKQYPDGKRIREWERIYLELGVDGFFVERRGKGATGRPMSALQPQEDIIAMNQKLRMEIEYLRKVVKKLQDKEERI